MILIGCDYSKGNGHATNEVMTQQWSKYAELTSNAKCNVYNEEKGMSLHEVQDFSFKCNCNNSYMKI